MKLYLYRTCPTDRPQRRLIATFLPHARREAQHTLATLRFIASNAHAVAHNAYYDSFRYDLEEELAPPSPRPHKDCKVDTSAAQRTVRPIRFTLGYHMEHNMRVYVATHLKYGTVRGVVPDSGHGAHVFFDGLKTVWPHGEIVS